MVRGFDDQQIAGSSSSQLIASSVYMTQSAAGPSSSGSATISSISSIQPPSVIVSADDRLSSLSSVPMHAGACSSSAGETSSCCSGVSSVSTAYIQSSSLAGSNNTSDWDSSSADSCYESEMRNALTAASSNAGCSSSSTYTPAAAAAARSLSPVASTSATFNRATASHFLNSSFSPIYAGDDAAVIGDCDDNIMWETWSPPKSYSRQDMSAGSQHAIVANSEHKKRKKNKPMNCESGEEDEAADCDDNYVALVGKSPKKRQCCKEVAASSDAEAETSVKKMSDVLKSKTQPANMTAVKEWKGELFTLS